MNLYPLSTSITQMAIINCCQTSQAHTKVVKEAVEYYRALKIKFIEKLKNLANILEVRAIEDFWSILKGKVYENAWVAKYLDKLKNKIRLCLKNMDLNLVQCLLASTSTRL